MLCYILYMKDMGEVLEKELIDNLLNKSEEAFLMAIEIYNKPTINYRLEGFTFFICNAWELLLKAKILNDGNSIYFFDKPDRTISLSNCIKNIFTNDKDPVSIPALGISRCISGDEVDGFRAHQVGATDSSNGIGRYLQFFSHGKLYQYLIVPFTGKLYGTDLSDTISPIDYTTGNFQSIHPVINTIKHIIPVEQCFRFQKINSPDQYNNSSNCC